MQKGAYVAPDLCLRPLLPTTGGFLDNSGGHLSDPVRVGAGGG